MFPRHLLATLCIVLPGLVATSSLRAEPFGFAINSRGDFTDDSRINALWSVNLATGEAEYLGSTGNDFIGIDGLAMDAEERLFAADDATKTLLRIARGSGLATPVGNGRHNMRLPVSPPLDFGITFTCDGVLLISAAATGELYSGNPDSGGLTLLGKLDQPIVDMATIGDRIYGIGRGSDAEGRLVAPDLYLIDPAIPAATRIGALGEAVAPYNQAGLAADAEGNLWAITNRRNPAAQGHPFVEGEIHRIDPLTGQAEKISDTLIGFESLAIAPPGPCDDPGRGEPGDEPPSAVPALSWQSLWLLVLIMGGIALVRMRRSGA